MSGQLQQFVARIERLEEERKTIAGDISEVYKEAKANGFDVKILRKVIAKRKKSSADLQEEEAMIDVYMASLGANVGDVQTFTRKDGVKVTYERVSHDPVTGEITESNSGAVDASSAPDAAGEIPSKDCPAANHSDDGVRSTISDQADGEGATSPSANPSAGVIAIEPQATACDPVAGNVTPAVPDSDSVVPHGAVTQAVEDSPGMPSSTADLDDLAIPPFLKRSPPPVAPIERVFP